MKAIIKLALIITVALSLSGCLFPPPGGGWGGPPGGGFHGGGPR